MIRFFDLPEEDQPPERIWLDDQRLTEWFEAVRHRRKAEASGHEAITDDDLADMTANELTRGMTRG